MAEVVTLEGMVQDLAVAWNTLEDSETEEEALQALKAIEAANVAIQEWEQFERERIRYAIEQAGR